MIIIISPPAKFSGELAVPGDKSISHRAAVIGALAQGTTEVEGFLEAGDCLSTVCCLKALGVDLDFRQGKLVIRGLGPALQQPGQVLDAGNSGTTARLLLGVLAGQPFTASLTGDESLRARPMGRVVEPLRLMGAFVDGDGLRLPLTIRGGKLSPLEYKMPVASAQVKSALLLAGLYAGGVTVIEEPHPSRNHSELMLAQFGASIEVQDNRVSVSGSPVLKGRPVKVPGDISAAAFFLVAASIIPGAEVTLRGVGVNPTRSGIIDLLREMGADIRVGNPRFWGGEPVADLHVTGGAPLRGIDVGGALIPRVIDEIPVLAVAAAAASGVTAIRDAGELRVKESDRIVSMAREISKLGVKVNELPDGLRIEGGPLRGSAVESHGDHRVAMALAVAGLAAPGETAVRNAEVINISFPGFMSHLRRLIQ